MYLNNKSRLLRKADLLLGLVPSLLIAKTKVNGLVELWMYANIVR